MKILITGSSGILATKIISYLVPHHEVYTFSRDKKITPHHADEEKFSNDELINLNINVDIVIHCAFTRSENSAELASSLQFTSEVANFCTRNSVKHIINISSQSVYSDQLHGFDLNEESLISPSTKYGLAKFASELILKTSLHNRLTNIRLASLIGEGMEIRALHRMVLHACTSQEISVVNGDQYCSLISIDNAAKSIVDIALTPKKSYLTDINLSDAWQPSMSEIANKISNKVKKELGFEIKINAIQSSDNSTPSLKINTERLFLLYGIKVNNSIEDTISKIISSRIN